MNAEIEKSIEFNFGITSVNNPMKYMDIWRKWNELNDLMSRQPQWRFHFEDDLACWEPINYTNRNEATSFIIVSLNGFGTPHFQIFIVNDDIDECYDTHNISGVQALLEAFGI